MKKQYAVPIYNFENINLIPPSELELTINDQLFLEVLLMEIRGETIRFASDKKKRKQNKEHSLEQEIQSLEIEFAESNNMAVLERIENKKIEIEELRREKGS